MAIDHDRLTKELLTTFLYELIDLFFPEVARYIDRDSIVMLDKEIFADVGTKEKHEADLVAKVRFRGSDAYFVFHAEAQSSAATPIFPRRMFYYFSGLHRREGLPVYPIAIFTHDAPRTPVPDTYTVEFPDMMVLEFKFRVIQLNRLDWRNYLRSANPAAWALMAKMNIAVEDRPRVKMECLRLLAGGRLDPARTMLISAYIDSYLKLNAEETKIFKQAWEQVAPEEKQMAMQLTNSWVEEGIEKGIVKGIVKGEAKMVLRALKNRFGQLDEEQVKKIESLEEAQIEKLVDDYPSFSTNADLAKWLETV